MTSKKPTHYVFSTLTASQNYLNYGEGGADIPVANGEGVHIYGGSNLPDKIMVTPVGVCTPVTDEELEYLQANDVFKKHVENGYIKVEKKDGDPEKVAADMETRDKSAPLVDQDFADGQAPLLNDGKEDKNTPKPSNRRA